MSRQARPAKRAAATSVRNLNYATSPLLASKTPPWRSRFVVALVGLGFLLLVGRAVYIQIIGTDFYQQQGEKRYGHVIEMPASRGRILDRDGLVLATSVPVPSVWAIPKDFAADAQQRKALAKLLDMKPSELEQKLDGGGRNFAWLKRQVDAERWRLPVSWRMTDTPRTAMTTTEAIQDGVSRIWTPAMRPTGQPRAAENRGRSAPRCRT